MFGLKAPTKPNTTAIAFQLKTKSKIPKPSQPLERTNPPQIVTTTMTTVQHRAKQVNERLISADLA